MIGSSPHSAMLMAHRVHTGQMYGSQPYVAHLASVVAVLLDCGYGGDEEMIAAAWLHDSIEDQNVERWEIEDNWSKRTADLVWAVTGRGPDRVTRNLDIYRKIANYPEAAILKMADRIANVEQSDPDGKHWQMYHLENDEFLRRVGVHAPGDMVVRLKRAFERC